MSVGVSFVFVVSSRRRHTRGALVTGVQTCALPIFVIGRNLLAPRELNHSHHEFPQANLVRAVVAKFGLVRAGSRRGLVPGFLHLAAEGAALHLCEVDRKSVVLGKSVSVRVDLGGRRIIKKKNLIQYHCNYWL